MKTLVFFGRRMYGYIPDIQNKHGESPLHIACTKGDVQAVRAIVFKRNCNVNIHTSTGQTPLHLVVRAKHGNVKSIVTITSLLLSVPDCDPLITDAQGVTPLEIAYKTSPQIFMLILEKGFSGGYSREEEMVEKAMTLTDELLHIVCRFKPNAKVVQSILRALQSHPALINELDPSTGDSPLHAAVRKGNAEATEVLLDSEYCDPNVRTDPGGDTPLIVACKVAVDKKFTSYQVISLLLSNDKCDPNIQNNDGNTALHIAVARGCQEALESLFRCVVAVTNDTRCDLNALDRHHDTALHIAIKGAHDFTPIQLSIIDHLVSDHRCDVTAPDLEGNTPLHIVCRKGSWNRSSAVVDIVRALLSTGKVDPQCVNSAGETPVQLAITNQQLYKELSSFCKTKLNHPIETYVKIFVVGNAETGKSTLIQAIRTEAFSGLKYTPAQFKTVKGVKSHTAGIVPIPVQSRHFGNAIIYDFAGQHEYYSSHAAVLENLTLSSPPVFLLLVNLSEPFEKTSEMLAYWWSFIGSYAARNRTSPHVAVVGSHKDIVKQRGERPSVVMDKHIGTLDGLPTNFTLAGSVTIDCTKVASEGLTGLRSLLKQSCQVLRTAVAIDQRCHILSAFLQDSFPNRMSCTLSDVIERIRSEQNTLLPQLTPDLMMLLATLSDKDRILLLKNSDKLESSWIILQRQKLFGDINGSIFAPEYFDEYLADFARCTGIVPLTKIKEHFPQYQPDIITGFLSHLEFCFEISDAQTLELIAAEEEFSPDEGFYFFPALVQVKNPPKEKVWKNELQSSQSKQNHQKLKYGWFYECVHPYQYLMSRFLYVLLFRLAFSFALAVENRPTHNFPAIRRRCSVWKRGIAWLNNDGIETVVEVGLQNQWVVVLMQCPAGMEVECAKLRSAVIKVVSETKEEFCPSIGMCESLLHPDSIDYPFQRTELLSLYRMKEVSRVIVRRQQFAVDEAGSNSTCLSELLPFEPFIGLSEVELTLIFSSEYAHEKIPDSILQRIAQVVVSVDLKLFLGRLELFAKALLPPEVHLSHADDPVVQFVHLLQQAQVTTFEDLKEKLSKFSIFQGQNPLDLAGLPPAPQETFSPYINDVCANTDLTSLLEQTDDSLLNIVSLLEVRTEVASAVGHSNELGLALGLSHDSTLQEIQLNYHDVAVQLTEVIAAWLQGTEAPSWRSLAKALLDPTVNHPRIAQTIMERHPRDKDSSELCSAEIDDPTYQDVDGTQLKTRDLIDPFRAVVQGGHFSWLHFGLVIGLHYGTLKAIQSRDCLSDVLLRWLKLQDSVSKRGHPSWRTLARALAHPLVGQQRLADKVAREHPTSVVACS